MYRRRNGRSGIVRGLRSVKSENPLSEFSSPEDVVRAGLAAHVAGDWHRLASLVEPSSLDAWCRDFVETNTHIRSVDEWQEENPEVRRADLERFAESMAERVRAYIARLPDHFADVHTLDELAQLSSAELLVRIIQRLDPIELLNRDTAAAYAAAAIPRPESTHHARYDRSFEILEREHISDRHVDVHFREHGAAYSDTWACTLTRPGQWQLLMDVRIVQLRGVNVGYIDDPIVIAYMNRRSND